MAVFTEEEIKIYTDFINSFNEAIIPQNKKDFLIVSLRTTPDAYNYRCLITMSINSYINTNNIDLLKKELNNKMTNEKLKAAFNKMTDRTFCKHLYRLYCLYAAHIATPEKYIHIEKLENELIKKYH